MKIIMPYKWGNTAFWGWGGGGAGFDDHNFSHCAGSVTTKGIGFNFVMDL